MNFVGIGFSQMKCFFWLKPMDELPYIPSVETDGNSKKGLKKQYHQK
jgi:hypothetical protein